MIKVRIEEKPAFNVLGKKTWISGTDNDIFGEFWQDSHKKGLINKLMQLQEGRLGKVTKSNIIGISCVEENPSNRSFFFYIAAEANEFCVYEGLEKYTVPAAKWAIFQNEGQMPEALIEAEMHAFTQWLPNSNYIHAKAPELEVYPPALLEQNISLVEFWLPIVEK